MAGLCANDGIVLLIVFEWKLWITVPGALDIVFVESAIVVIVKLVEGRVVVAGLKTNLIGTEVVLARSDLITLQYLDSSLMTSIDPNIFSSYNMSDTSLLL